MLLPIDWSMRIGSSGSQTATPSVDRGRRSAGRGFDRPFGLRRIKRRADDGPLARADRQHCGGAAAA